MQKSTEKIAKSPTIVGRLYYTVWSKSAVGNESVPKIIINDTINIFFVPAKAFARDYGITGVRLFVCLSVCQWCCSNGNI